MVKIYFILFTGLLVISLPTYAQLDTFKSIPSSIIEARKLIIGKWRSTLDSNETSVTVFTKDSCYVVDGKDTLVVSHYIISDSCCVNKVAQCSYNADELKTFEKEEKDGYFIWENGIASYNDKKYEFTFFDCYKVLFVGKHNLEFLTLPSYRNVPFVRQ